MPKAGYTSFTVTDLVYDAFFAVYKKNKEELNMIGVTSFTGYITHMMNETLKVKAIFEKYKPRFKLLQVKNGIIIIFDSCLDRVAEIKIKTQFCELCQSKKCSHIGFCYSLRQFYDNSDK